MMNSVIPLGAFSNLLGWDGIVILVVQAAFVVGLISLVWFIVRRNAPDQSGGAPEASLQKLDSLRASDAITESEYQEQRRRILSRV